MLHWQLTSRACRHLQFWISDNRRKRVAANDDDDGDNLIRDVTLFIIIIGIFPFFYYFLTQIPSERNNRLYMHALFIILIKRFNRNLMKFLFECLLMVRKKNKVFIHAIKNTLNDCNFKPITFIKSNPSKTFDTLFGQFQWKYLPFFFVKFSIKSIQMKHFQETIQRKFSLSYNKCSSHNKWSLSNNTLAGNKCSSKTIEQTGVAIMPV